MKLIHQLTFASAFILLTQIGKAQVGTADSMVYKLFASLKNKDKKAFVALYPNSQQFIKFTKKVLLAQKDLFKQFREIDSSLAPKRPPMNFDSLFTAQINRISKPEVFDSLKEVFGKTFSPVISQGEVKGVNWTTANLESYTLDSTALADSNAIRMMGPGFKNMKAIISFSSGNNAYRISIKNIFYIPEEGGWFGGEFNEVIRKGEIFLQEGKTRIERTSSDTTFITTTSEMPKTKTKTSSGNIKSKTKTKSPARKPSPKS